MTRIVDCVVAFNETEMFEIRARELSDVVDAFVVVEASKTHRGENKPLFFHGISELFPSLTGRLFYQAIADLPRLFAHSIEFYWMLENYQRNCILFPLSQMGLDDQDIIMVSDVDEIPRAESVAQLRDALASTNIVIFEQLLKKFFLNNASFTCGNNLRWRGTVACRYGHLKNISPQAARIGDPYRARSGCPSYEGVQPHEKILLEAGWHFSSMGGLAALATKDSSIVEGVGSFRPVISDGRRGRHNHRSYREQYLQHYESFFKEFAPDITPVDIVASDSLSNFDLPDCVKDNPQMFEHLFYIKTPFDD